MTVEEAKKAIEEMKAQGQSEEDIAGAFYLLFVDGQVDVNQLNALMNLLGYHLTDDFLAMSDEDQKTHGFEESDEKAEDVTDEEVEKAKDEDTTPFDKEDEEKKAMKLFGN